jgi:hypothetical protein
MPSRVCALLLLVAMGLVAGSPRVLGYVCRIDRATHMSCCCGARAEVAARDGSHVERRRCCDATSDDARVPAMVRSDDRASAPMVALVHAPVLPEGSSAARSSLWYARGSPPATGPPLFLRDCRFLI